MEAKRPVKVGSADGPIKANPTAIVPDSMETQQLFISSALSMSWQMAIAVLVPIVGGYYLDQHLKTTPWFFLIGLLLAVALVVLIIRKTIRQLPEYVKGSKGKLKH